MQFPHCDQRILHAPGECKVCDAHPDWQTLRGNWGIAFTGHAPLAGQYPCVADATRGERHQAWPGNRPAIDAGPPEAERPAPISSGLTDDPSDPRLGRGVDTAQTDQHEVYLVLSEEERAKGFVRPVRRSYRHVGPAGPRFPLRDLTVDERRLYLGDPAPLRGHVAPTDFSKFEVYPAGFKGSATGRFWTHEELDAVGKGCGVVTTMGLALAETYARQPSFYGATYCCGCSRHLAVAEFAWEPAGSGRVGE